MAGACVWIDQLVHLTTASFRYRRFANVTSNRQLGLGLLEIRPSMDRTAR